MGDHADDDDDNDGLDDLFELMMGTDPLDPDSDNDGISDLDESIAGTDPLDPNDPAQVPLANVFGTGILVLGMLWLGWAVLRSPKRPHPTWL